MARSSVWIMMARLLWAFDIAEGDAPRPEGPRAEDPMASTSGFLTRPLPFNAVFRPRGPWARTLIAETCDTHGQDLAPLLDQVAQDWKAKAV